MSKVTVNLHFPKVLAVHRGESIIWQQWDLEQSPFWYESTDVESGEEVSSFPIIPSEGDTFNYDDSDSPYEIVAKVTSFNTTRFIIHAEVIHILNKESQEEAPDMLRDEVVKNFIENGWEKNKV